LNWEAAACCLRWCARRSLLLCFRLRRMLFTALIAPHALQLMRAREVAELDGRSSLLVRGSLVAATLALLAWLVLEASAMSEAASATQALTAIPSVLLSTSFGGVLFAQALALLAANLASRVHPSARRRLATVGLAGLATALQAGHSHAFAMEDGLSLLLFSQGLHLLATGAWLGGLVPLLIVVREAAPKAATEALALFRSRCSLRCRDYGWRLAGGVNGLTGTAYGWVR
jgi:putative copper resistance protein D